MKNCEHRPEYIESEVNGIVTCRLCNTVMDITTWEDRRKKSFDKEVRYILRDMKPCYHPSSRIGYITENGNKYHCDCGEVLGKKEYELMREAQRLERRRYLYITDSNKTDMIISLRMLLEKAHGELEVSVSKGDGIGDYRYIPLHERDIEKNGIDRLSIRNQVIESEYHKVSESRERMMKKLMELGIDIDEYLLVTEKVGVDEDVSEEVVSVL